MFYVNECLNFSLNFTRIPWFNYVLKIHAYISDMYIGFLHSYISDMRTFLICIYFLHVYFWREYILCTIHAEKCIIHAYISDMHILPIPFINWIWGNTSRKWMLLIDMSHACQICNLDSMKLAQVSCNPKVWFLVAYFVMQILKLYYVFIFVNALP